ncbi:hypothetical protein [Sabulibacter ruber]|uniref:hypothetical protein n=1 Tax=Sabulibacter ruber TaxID=2811901 RepID=UPI001A971DC8|nr:hypothetical protein [Sabulibacter ruber]
MLYIGFIIVSAILFIAGAFTIEKMEARSQEKSLMRMALFALIIILGLPIMSFAG